MLELRHGTGNPDASIVFLKDMPSFDEVRSQEFNSDNPGREFKKMCAEAGIIFSDTYTTSVSKSHLYGKNEDLWTDKKTKKGIKNQYLDGMYLLDSIFNDIQTLKTELDIIRPVIVVPLGPLSLWCLTREQSTHTWRGSVNWSDFSQSKVIASHDPAMVIKVWAWRYHSVRDLQRVAQESKTREISIPDYNFTIAPTFDQVMIRLQSLINQAEKGMN